MSDAKEYARAITDLVTVIEELSGVLVRVRDERMHTAHASNLANVTLKRTRADLKAILRRLENS